ncbi:MAG: terminase family protein, partial [Phenylobacterium sp.]|nr:terminase family protein [Phenylobacterium sp.]
MGKPSKLSDEEWEALFDRDARGERRSDLAREHGVSISTICWQAKKRGRMKGQAPDAVDHRRRPAEGWPADHVFPQSRSGMTPARWRELLARRNAGETSAVLEAEYGVTTGAIGCAAQRYGLRKMDTPGAVYQPRGPAAGAYNYGRGEPALTIEIDWSDPVGTVRELHADVLKRLSDGDEPEAARLWRWSQRTRVMAGVGAADLRALWKRNATSRGGYRPSGAFLPGGYRPAGYMSPQTPGLLEGGQGAGGLVLRPAQQPPEGDWSTWLFLGGRGAGKTLAGASWIADMAERLGAGGRLALIGPTLHDVREVMIAGPSGVMSLPRWTGVGGDGEVEWRGPEYQPSRRRLVFPNGAEAFVFSAEDPDSLRGPQFAAAWADEFCAWRNGGETLALLRMGLRLRLPNPDSPAVDPSAAHNGGVGAQGARLREPSDSPRLVVTTTPRPTRALKALRAEASCALTHATTRDNGDHLAPGFLEGLERLYGGTRRAAQELEGQVVEPEGGLFTAEMMAAARGEAPVSVEG